MSHEFSVADYVNSSIPSDIEKSKKFKTSIVKVCVPLQKKYAPFMKFDTRPCCEKATSLDYLLYQETCLLNKMYENLHVVAS